MYDELNEDILSIFLKKEEILPGKEIKVLLRDDKKYEYAKKDESFFKLVQRKLDKLDKLSGFGLEIAKELGYNGEYQHKKARYYLLSNKFEDYSLFGYLLKDINSDNIHISDNAKKILINRRITASQIESICDIYEKLIKSNNNYSEFSFYLIAILNNVTTINNSGERTKEIICSKLINFLEWVLEKIEDNYQINFEAEKNLEHIKHTLLKILIKLDEKYILDIFEKELIDCLNFEKTKFEQIKIIGDRIKFNSSDLSTCENPSEEYYKKILYEKVNTISKYLTDPVIKTYLSKYSFKVYSIFKKCLIEYPDSLEIIKFRDSLYVIFNNLEIQKTSKEKENEIDKNENEPKLEEKNKCVQI